MNVKTTLFLLTILIGIGVYFLVFEKGRISTIEPGPADDGEKPVFTADELYPDGVKTVTIDWADSPAASATLTRDATGHWMQTRPVSFPLNAIRLQGGLVYDAATLRYVERFIPGKDGKPTLAHTSLDKPRVTVRFTGEARDTQIDAAGKPQTTTAPFDQTIRIGGGLTGSRGYIRINDDPHVYVVNHPLHAILLRERPADWRVRNLDAPTDTQANLISLAVEGQSIQLNKIKGDWQFGLPLTDRVTPKAPAALLGLIKGVQIGRFIDDQPKDMSIYGLDKPSITVTVHTELVEPRVRTLRIGNAADPEGATYHASWSMGTEASTVVFTILRDSRAMFLAPKADDLRDPRITPLKSAGISEIKILAADQTPVQLQRTVEAGWSFLVPKGQPAIPYKPDQEAVGQLLDSIVAASAKYFRPQAPRPQKPRATIELSSKGAPAETLIFFTPPEGTRPKGDDTDFIMVLRNNETTGYLVPAAKLERVLEPAVKLRDRQVIDLKPEKNAKEILFQSVTIERSDGVGYTFKTSQPLVDTSGKTQWAMRAMLGAEKFTDKFERETFEYLLKQLSALRAESWVVGEGKFGDNTATVTIETKGGAPLVMTIDLDSRHGKIAGTDGVFMLGEQIKLLLDAEYRPRSVLQLSPGDVTQITITKTGADPLTIARSDLGRFQVLGPDGQPVTTKQVNPTTAARLFDALMPLRAWRYAAKPPQVQPKDAATTIELVTRTGQKHTVSIGFKDRPTLATVNDVWFTLLQEAVDRLTAEPLKKDEKGR